MDTRQAGISVDTKIYPADLQIIEDYLSMFYRQEMQDINQIIDNLDDIDFQFVSDEDG